MVSNFLLKKCLSKYTIDSHQCLMKVAGYQSPATFDQRPEASDYGPVTSRQKPVARGQRPAARNQKPEYV